MKINDQKVEQMIDSIEDYARRKIADYEQSVDINYIDNDYNLRKMKKSNNNIIEARRGCGKTTLFLKSIYQNSDNISVIQDCQVFKDYHYSKIVSELLNSITNYLLQELQTKYKELDKVCIFKKNRKELKEIKDIIIKANNFNRKLNELTEIPEELIFEYSKQLNDEKKESSSTDLSSSCSSQSLLEMQFNQDFIQLESKLKATFDFIAKHKIEHNSETQNTININGSKRISKKDLFEDVKKIFVILIKIVHEKIDKNIVLYLDDFYMINKSYHPIVLKYFHDIYKLTKKGAFCFKIVTLPSSLQLNIGKEKIFSVKDDYSLIQLDYDLSNLDQIQTHLFEIIQSLSRISIIKSEFESLFSDDKTLKELIIATGGIPRDFMKAFSEAVRIGLRNSHNTIHKKDIYEVIKNLKEDKDRNIEIDSELSVESIELAVNEILNCVEKNIKTNVFLYPLDLAEKHDYLLKNLVNLRYLHLIKAKVASKSKKNYRAYLIDMTFYATGSWSKNVSSCAFWEKDENRNLDNLRKSPEWFFSDNIINQIEKIESENKQKVN